MKGRSSNRGLGGIASRRRKAVRVRATRQRSASPHTWLQRQLNDPYVVGAKEDSHRSRAALKLLQLDEKFRFLKPGLCVVGLGAAPGGWSQVVAEKIGEKGKLVAIDILPMSPLPGVESVQMDFLADKAAEKLKVLLQKPADLVFSELAPSVAGHTSIDPIRITALTKAAALFAMEVLAPGGAFVCKFFQGGVEKEFLDVLKKHFAKVKHVKPAANRPESSETYLVAQGFRKGR